MIRDEAAFVGQVARRLAPQQTPECFPEVCVLPRVYDGIHAGIRHGHRERRLVHQRQVRIARNSDVGDYDEIGHPANRETAQNQQDDLEKENKTLETNFSLLRFLYTFSLINYFTLCRLKN